MGPKTGCHALLALSACLVTACGAEQTFSGPANEVTAAVQRAAIPLDQAVKQGVVKVITRDHNSTRTEMGLVLKPTGTSQPWIRIDAGWQVADPEKPDHVYITTETRYARLAKRKNLLVTIPHVQQTLFRSFGIPTGAVLSRCEDQQLLDFFAAVGKRAEPPTWKELQIATWMLTQDISYAQVRVPPSDGKVRLRTHPVVGSAEIQHIVGMLEDAGYARGDFALWNGALDEVDRLVGLYDALADAEERSALGPFRQLCDLYPLESASDVLVGAFDRHTGRKGMLFRRYAFDVLRRVGGSPEMTLIKRYADMEPDSALAKAMAQTVKSAAAAAAASAASPAK